MTVSILLFLTRAPHVDAAAFRTYYEDKHIPLIQSIVGSAWPESHKRMYVESVMVPGAAGEGVDCIAEATFKDEDAFKAFAGKFYEPESKAKIEEDELNFVDRSKSRLVMSSSQSTK